MIASDIKIKIKTKKHLFYCRVTFREFFTASMRAFSVRPDAGLYSLCPHKVARGHKIMS